MEYKLEVIAFTPECCTDIQMAGAHRIELCSAPSEGGTTPSYGFIKVARKKVSIELFPIIRPRGGDFLYNASEFRTMISDIRLCKQTGCEGIVTGILKADGTIDKKRCMILVEEAYPMSVTFHRAFDRTPDPYASLEDIIEVGCERILSSGLMPTAMEGISLIRDLIKKADSRISIMPGSGVRSTNICEIISETGAFEIHSSARRTTTGLMQYQNGKMNEKLTHQLVDKKEVENMITALSGI